MTDSAAFVTREDRWHRAFELLYCLIRYSETDLASYIPPPDVSEPTADDVNQSRGSADDSGEDA